ncbi:hypothetical protein [Cellulomonas sp. Y8]|uniref:hypothetical protein n=1 Tax=Cellulomonas sp. Y8 TaxID=2591145 RepID=UPI0011C8EA48|nr:hypothetical protein [Cellulomonas sp. Y8]
MPPVFHDDPHHPSLRTFVRDPSRVTHPPLWTMRAGRDLQRSARVAARAARTADERRAAWQPYRLVDALLRRRWPAGGRGTRDWAMPTAGRARRA